MLVIARVERQLEAKHLHWQRSSSPPIESLAEKLREGTGCQPLPAVLDLFGSDEGPFGLVAGIAGQFRGQPNRETNTKIDRLCESESPCALSTCYGARVEMGASQEQTEILAVLVLLQAQIPNADADSNSIRHWL